VTFSAHQQLFGLGAGQCTVGITVGFVVKNICYELLVKAQEFVLRCLELLLSEDSRRMKIA